MGTLLDDLGAYLIAYTPTLSLVEATNFFASDLPDSPDSCTVIYEYSPGSGGMETFGVSDGLRAIEENRVQLVVRDPSYSTAITLHRKIWIALRKIVNTTLSGTYYERVVDLTPPFLFHRDDTAQRRVYTASNYAVLRSPTS